MVIICIRRKVLVQRSLTGHNHMIQALATDRADQPFDVSSLPRRPWRRQHLLNALRFHLIHELLAEDPVAVADVKGKVMGDHGGGAKGDHFFAEFAVFL